MTIYTEKCAQNLYVIPTVLAGLHSTAHLRRNTAIRA